MGLDIGSHCIKVIEIHSTPSIPSMFRVENFISASLPEDVVVKNEIKDTAVIGQILKNALTQANIKNKYFAVSVPRSSVMVKMTTVDSRLTVAEIESRAWLEAHRQFPEVIGGIYLDYQVLGASFDANQLDLMLVACRKEQIDPLLEILKQSDVVAELIDVSCYALHRAISLVTNENDSLDTVALLNLDFSLSSLVVVHQNKLIYAHDHTFEGDRLMAKAKEYLNRTPSEMNIPKEEQVLVMDANHRESMVDLNLSSHGVSSIGGRVMPPSKPVVQPPVTDDPAYLEILRENLIAQLRHVMHFFYSSKPNMSIKKLILSGDCVTLPKIELFVQQEIGVETIIANPLLPMEVAPHVNKQELQMMAPGLMLASGLSLRSEEQINLLPWREQAKQEKKKKFVVVVILFMFIAFIMAIIIHFYLTSLIKNQGRINSYLQSEISTEQAVLTKLQKKKKDQIDLTKKVLFLVGLQTKSNNAVRLLDEIAHIIPSTVVLSRLASDSNIVIIEGVAQSDLDITSFMQKISESSVFGTPILTEINTKNMNQEGEKSFQLKVIQH